jgi:hypothetical protein
MRSFRGHTGRRGRLLLSGRGLLVVNDWEHTRKLDRRRLRFVGHRLDRERDLDHGNARRWSLGDLGPGFND